jgi:hypothetical protein
MNLSKVILIICLFPYCLRAQGNWNLEKDKNGIRVYTRQSGYSKFNEIKVECVMEGTISQLIAVIQDINLHVDWVYNTKRAYILNRISDSELYFYSEINATWPFRNRDAIAHMKILRDSLTKEIIVEVNSVPDYLPIKKDMVRIPMSKVIWKISNLNDKSIKINYYMGVNPGGSVPAWLINLFIANGPLESFTKLRERIKLAQYKQVHFSFIKD